MNAFAVLFTIILSFCTYFNIEFFAFHRIFLVNSKLNSIFDEFGMNINYENINRYAEL